MASKNKNKPEKYVYQKTFQNNQREFRKQLTNLKKSGMLPAGVDIRTAKRSDPKLKRIITQHNDIATGHAQAFKVPKEILREMKSQGYDTYKNERVIVQKMPEEVFESRSGGDFEFRNPITGLHRYIINVDYENLQQWFEDAMDEAEAEEWAQYWRFGFRFFGNPSHQTYLSPHEALESLYGYRAVTLTLRHGDEDEEEEIYNNIEIIAINLKEAGIDYRQSGMRVWDKLKRPKNEGGPYSGTRRPKGMQNNLRIKPKRKKKKVSSKKKRK